MTDESSSPGKGAAGPLAALARQVRDEAARTVWACLLEATAVKAGNVHPTAAFRDLSYRDFLAAGEAIAPLMAGPDEGIGAVTLAAVRATRQACRSNVNLGIILLLAPLRQAARQVPAIPRPGIPGQSPPQRLASLRKSLIQVLRTVTAEDGALVFQAIREAQPGGLGEADAMDVRTTTEVDLIAAMRAAAKRDLIARQYAGDFVELFDLVIPTLDAALQTEGDWLEAIRWGQLALLARLPDTLILRKGGTAAAEETRQRAAAVEATPAGPRREAAWQAFDAWLRTGGHQRNPGAIADLIAAGLWLLFYREEREI